MTMEEQLSQKQNNVLKGSIIEGWLQDDIIGAYLYRMCLGRSELRYCEAA